MDKDIFLKRQVLLPCTVNIADNYIKQTDHDSSTVFTDMYSLL